MRCFLGSQTGYGLFHTFPNILSLYGRGLVSQVRRERQEINMRHIALGHASLGLDGRLRKQRGRAFFFRHSPGFTCAQVSGPGDMVDMAKTTLSPDADNLANFAALKTLIKDNIKKEECQAVLVTGAGISAQLLDRDPLQKHPKDERNALIKMVSSWTGLYEHLCDRLVGDRFIEEGIKPRMLQMLLCITQLVMNGELSLKAAQSMPLPAVSNKRPRYVNMGSPEDWEAYLAKKGDVGLGWSKMFDSLGILVDTDKGPQPCLEQTKGSLDRLGDIGEWRKHLSVLREDTQLPKAWKMKEEKEACGNSAAAEFIQFYRRELEKKIGSDTFLIKGDDLKTMVEAAMVRAGLQPRKEGNLVEHLKTLCNNLPLFTTNYDTFQEQALGRYAVDADSMYNLENSKLVKPDCLSLQDHVDNLLKSNRNLMHWLYVVHLHGLFYKGNFVLSPDQYARSLRKNCLLPFLQALVSKRSLIFCGAGRTIFDPHWLLLWLREMERKELWERFDRPKDEDRWVTRPRKHYMIVSDSAKEELKSIIKLIHHKDEKELKAIKDCLIPDKTVDGQHRRAAIGKDDDWKALARYNFPAFFVEGSPKRERKLLRAWMEEHIIFVSYEVDADHTGLVKLLADLAEAAEQEKGDQTIMMQERDKAKLDLPSGIP